ncbi:TPA: efflux RND transporter periplasmic adaptor subunit, partial [Enterobacter kobei]|nr:efflux RND transporter periplasmic adaptor subunit [Enterobacter kobei]
GNEKHPVSATLRLLSDSADATTRTYEARYVLNGDLANAPLGATVTLNVQDPKAERQVMQVPLASLYDAGKGPGVWRISARPAKVTWTPVKVLSVGEDAAQVTGSVKPGEKIVALGAHLLHEGEIVRLAEQRNAALAENTP